MKKILGIVLIVVGFIMALTGAITFYKITTNAAPNISIIGGADGPTAIFLAGEIGGPIFVAVIGGVIAFVVGLVLVLKKRG